MVTEQNRKEARELIEYIVKCNVNRKCKDNFDRLVKEYRKEFSQLILAKIVCLILYEEGYVPYRQEFFNKKMLWEVERYEIFGKQVQFFYNNIDKISKQEAMRCCWFHSDGKSVFGDCYYTERTDYIVLNKESDFIVLYVPNTMKIYEIVKKLINNNGKYEEQDVEILAEILSLEKLFGEYKHYIDEITGKKYYGFPFAISNKKRSSIDFVDKKLGVVSIPDEEYRRLKTIDKTI